MGLDDLTPKNDESSDSKRKYVQPSRDEFEEFLAGTELNWRTVQTDSGEIVYEATLKNHSPMLTLRLFSTIQKGKDTARDKGKDAIRTVIWHNGMKRPIGGRTKTLRIKTWKKNLQEKIESLKEEWEEYVKNCPECHDGFMVTREGEYGEFLGCTSYPDCDNTMSIDKDNRGIDA